MVVVVGEEVPPYSEIAPFCKHNNGHQQYFDNEMDSDVTFIVGPPDGDTWRFPGHTCVLSKVNNRIRDMFLTMPSSRTIFINDVNQRGFEQLLRYLYGLPISLQSLETALAVLKTGCFYQCINIVSKSIQYIDENLTSGNVLQVLEALGMNFTVISLDDNSIDAEIDLAVNELRTNCFIIVDSETNQVLENERFEDLTREDVEVLLKRDSLRPKREFDVWKAFERWLNRECKRLGVENTNAMKHKILTFSDHLVRFSLMRKREFMDGPANILTDAERDEIFRQMKNNERRFRNGDIAKAFPLSKRTLPRLTHQNSATSTGSGTSSTSNTSKNGKQRLFKCVDCICRTLVCIFD